MLSTPRNTTFGGSAMRAKNHNRMLIYRAQPYFFTCNRSCTSDTIPCAMIRMIKPIMAYLIVLLDFVTCSVLAPAVMRNHPPQAIITPASGTPIASSTAAMRLSNASSVLILSGFSISPMLFVVVVVGVGVAAAARSICARWELLLGTASSILIPKPKTAKAKNNDRAICVSL